jgi:hypothetical protein
MISLVKAFRPYVPGLLSLFGFTLLSWVIFAGPFLLLFAHNLRR